MRRLLLVVLIAFASACDAITGTGGLPDGVEVFDPPSMYRERYEEVSQCLGIEGDFDKIRFYHVPGALSITPDVAYSLGMVLTHSASVTSSSDQTFLIAGRVENSQYIVGHEFAHLLLGNKNSEKPAKKAGHPDKYFEGECRHLFVDPIFEAVMRDVAASVMLGW